MPYLQRKSDAIQAPGSPPPQVGDSAAPGRIPPYDIRLRRELSHRRLVVSLARRLCRVVSLHLLDGAAVAGSVLVLAAAWPGFAGTHGYLAAVVAVSLLSLNAFGAYAAGDRRRDRNRLLGGMVVAGAILATLTIFPPHLPLTPVLLAVLCGTVFLALSAGRKGVDQLVRLAYKRGIGIRRAVLVGDLDEVGRAIGDLRDERNIDQYVIGHLVPDGKPDPTALGSLAQLPAVLDEHDVQEVIIATSLPGRVVHRITEACFERGTSVYVIPSMIGPVHCRTEPTQVGSSALIHLHPARLELPSLLLKRGFDLTGASISLLILSPLLLLIALAIKLDSPGPVLFRQRRVGLGGRIFTMWKFRSMYVDSEAERASLAGMNAYANGRLFKVPADPRVTRVGRLLRRTSLDEVPQLFNVVLGEMSLVGPRPPLPCEVECYQPHHFDRLSVVPGITGPWQVGGRNLVTDFESVVRMERDYIRSWSLLVDAKILLRTVRVVLRGEGAF